MGTLEVHDEMGGEGGWMHFRATWTGDDRVPRPALVKRALIPGDADDLRALFEEDALITRRMVHPNILPLWHWGADLDGRFFFVVERIEGKTLEVVQRAARERNQPIAPALSAWIVARVLRGLAFAHAFADAKGNPLGVLHRGVVPFRIHLGWDGGVQLDGFAMERAETRRTGSYSGSLRGRFAHMSPEQGRGLPLDGRVDAFACAIVLYELLTGVQPFRGSTDFETLEAIRECRPTPPRELDAALDSALDAIVVRALRRDIGERWESASAFADALDAWMRAQPDPPGPRTLTRLLRGLFDPEALER